MPFLGRTLDRGPTNIDNIGEKLHSLASFLRKKNNLLSWFRHWTMKVICLDIQYLQLNELFTSLLNGFFHKS